jgi:hypothetical protein
MRIACVVAAAAVCAFAPAAASAGDLYVSHTESLIRDDTVTYEAVPGETNLVSVSSVFDGRIVNVYDSGAAITTPSEPHQIPLQGRTLYPCQLLDPHHGRCYVPDPRTLPENPADCMPGCTEGKLAGANALSISLGDGNDAYTLLSTSDPISAWIYGGTGDDRIIHGKAGFTNVQEQDGHNLIRVGYDSLPPRPLTDLIAGGSGPDEIHTANGSYNDVWCGGDVDTVTADVFDHVDSNCENVEWR